MTVRKLLGDHVLRSACSDRAVAGLHYDSRQVRPGELFFAFAGAQVDGHRFAPAAINAGAAAVVSERAAPDELARRWVQVKHGRTALAAAALEFYGRPDRRLKLTGVTGTNGKTTTVYLIDAILRAAGVTTARIGTIDHTIAGRQAAAVNTTPESLDLVRYLDELLREGGTHATLEVSSHALALGRVYGMDFHTTVFTNLSRDHLDFHEDMEAYRQAKRSLFDGAGGAIPRFAVINRDDPMGPGLLEANRSTSLSYGRSPDCAVRAESVTADFSGLTMRVATPQGEFEVVSSLRGEFNVLNILAATGAALCHGISLDIIAHGVKTCESVAGRFETVGAGQPFLVVVDYAHTVDALEHLIGAARALLEAEQRSGRILTLFGCGGDRDRGKRPMMGEIAGKLSDLVILTSDNPRGEDPLNIINDVLVGLKRVDVRYELEPDRHEAIRKALKEARHGDVVLLAGKGHEAYQAVGRKKVPFDDRETARKMLEEMGYRA